MSLLQSTPFVQTFGLNHGQNAQFMDPWKKQQSQQKSRSTSSFANLIHFARNPGEIASEAVEDWYHGSTKEERAKCQAVADRKQLLYLKLQTVMPRSRCRYYCR